VIPVYNEETVLEQTYARLRSTLDELGVQWSLLLVNDGSEDGTIAVLESLYRRDARVSYLSLSRNFGHQAAISAGLDHAAATADVVITMDADLQHPPEIISDLLIAWRLGYDIVHTRKISTERQSGARSAATQIAYGAIGRVAQVNIVPHASDFRLLDRDALAAVRDLPERGRLYRGLTPWIGFRQAVVPFKASARANGSSRYGFRQLAQIFGRAFFDFSTAPLHTALALGSAVLALCGAYLIYVLGAFALGYPMPRGFLSLIFVVVLLGSVNLTFTGILGVYLARIYNEVRGRPSYVVARWREHDLEMPQRGLESIEVRLASSRRGHARGDLQPL